MPLGARHSSPASCGPPGYRTLEPAQKTFARIEAEWEEQQGEKGFNGKHRPNLVFNLSSRAAQPRMARLLFWRHGKQPDWNGELRVWAKNIPRLMRTGFYWSSEDILQAVNDIHLHSSRHPDWCRRHRISDNRRKYCMKERCNEPTWRGVLIIESKDPSTILNFDINWVTKSTIVENYARKWQGDKVYYAKKSSPSKCYNAIYDQMPLKGWWLWPKSPYEDEEIAHRGEKDGPEGSHECLIQLEK